MCVASAIADIGAGWVLGQQCDGLLTVGGIEQPNGDFLFDAANEPQDEALLVPRRTTSLCIAEQSSAA
ncbi:hypothetical protein B0G83_12725 [Paraburkholderia sp. BL21I4N1]|nr:hypothetical protein B0G83_12725 [Paraburkholderia sp. BL21I4N1]